MHLVTVEQMRQLERHAHHELGWSYDDMMLEAGTQLAIFIRAKIAHIATPKITFLIGKGNNGGDSLIAARQLADDYAVNCYLLDPITDLKQVDRTNAVIISAQHDDGQYLNDLIMTSNLIVDGIFGIGVRLPLREHYADILLTINQIIRASKEHPIHHTPLIYPDRPAPRPHQIMVIAVDCPSGIDCDTGQTDPNTIPADYTLTFITPKIGQVLPPALSYVGELAIAPIGISAEHSQSPIHLTNAKTAKNILPYRPIDANKGTFGKALIIGGSANYYGAPSLSTIACYRTGTGIVTLASIQSVINIVARHPEPTFIPLPEQDGSISVKAHHTIENIAPNYDSLLIGVGMGTSDPAQEFLLSLLQAKLPPLILDADALNILSKQPSWWRLLPPDTIITPHPGEMGRLTGLSIPEIQANRLEITRQMSAEWGITVLLKGAHSIIASPDGQTAILPFKSSGLATAGTGDLLAGMIAGFKAQGLSSHHASVLGGYIHGLAGYIAEENIGERGVIASDILQTIPNALRWVENS